MEGTINKRTGLFIGMMIMMVSLVKAQSNLVFYHTKNQIQSSYLNPANLSFQEKFTFSIFPIAGTSIGINNADIIQEVYHSLKEGTDPDEDLKNAFNSIIQGDLFYERIENILLNFGYNSDIGSFSFHIKENAQLLSNFKGEFSEFLMSPTLQSVVINEPQSFPVEALHYREYSLGYAKEIIRNKLSVGLRAKLYYGKSSLFSEVEGKVIRENTNYYLQTSGAMRLSAPVDDVLKDGLLLKLNLSKDFTVGNYLMNSKNPGIGFDLGFNYKITPDLVFSASVIDLGKIKWKNSQNTMLFDSKYQFSKRSVTESINEDGLPILMKNYEDISLSDSISKLFEIKIDNSIYSKAMPATFYAGLNYRIMPKLTIGVVDRYIKSTRLNHNSFSITANYDVSKKLSVSTGYSIIGNLYNNIPLAFLYTWNSGQSYIGTDNFVSILYPSGSEFAGITFGTCFFLFRNTKKYKKQNEYLPYFKEKRAKSRTSKGLIFNNYPES